LRRAAGAVFLAALAARLAFVFLADEPLLFGHQQHYLNGALGIVEHSRALEFILREEDWRTWGGQWTMAPLYYLFAAAVFAVFGPHLPALQAAQCVLDSGVAVLVAWLACRVAGPRGWWAGLLYALYWPSIEMCQRTMTENAHTPLLVAGMAALVRVAAPEGGLPLRRAVGAGVLLGLSVLARAVGMAFVPLAAAWLLWTSGWRRSWRAILGFTLGAAAVIAPWTARQWWIVGDPSPIESVSIYNLWADNTLVDEQRLARQEYFLAREPTPAARRALAVYYAKQGITERWHLYPEKVWTHFRHFVRPEGLWVLLGAQQPWPAWRHLARLVLDDAILLIAVPLFAFFLVAGPASPERRLLLLWTAYYLLIVVVVFHNEIRYRSALAPFALAGAAGGAALLGRPERPRRGRALAGAALALALLLVMTAPFLGPAGRAVRAWWRFEPTPEGVAAAARADPGAARPWTSYGRWLAGHGRFPEALEAYREAHRRVDHHWTPRTVFPRLLAEAGRTEEAAAATAVAHELSRSADPWLVLELAWRDLPPPRGLSIDVGGNDYGAVRGFEGPLGDHRWTRHRAWLRIVPAETAAAYDVALEMASPEPSRFEHPEVRVSVQGGTDARFTIGRQRGVYVLRTPAPQDRLLLVRLEAPTWSWPGHPAEQGVAVYGMTVAPVRE
jgi:4-amino-4-deoxy-L-arabinose transferase-like glycosyltransferase